MFFAPKKKQTSYSSNKTQPYMLPTVLKAIFYEEGTSIAGDRYETVTPPIHGGVTVLIFNKDILIGQFDVSDFLMCAGPKDLLPHLYAQATVERALGAGWHGIDRPVVWS